jgi:hypothetical protein
MFQASFIKPQTSLLLGAAKVAPFFFFRRFKSRKRRRKPQSPSAVE